MTHNTTTIAAGIAAILLATPILAQQQQPARLSEKCRAEVTQLCGTDRSQMRGCLREKYAQLSSPCVAEVRAAAQARQTRQRPQPQPQPEQ